MILNLANPLYYRSTGKSLEELFSAAAQADAGYDALAAFHLSFSSESLVITPTGSGERNGWTEEEKRMIEKGEIPPKRDGEDFSLKEGRYHFSQLPFFQSENLPSLLLPYADREKNVYLRIFKESFLEVVTQLFAEA